MSIHIKTGDKWYTCASVHVKVSNTWHTCKQIYVKAGDAWHKCILTTKSVSTNVTTYYNKDSVVNLSSVKNGSTITITGNYDTGGVGGRLYGLKATGATLPTNYGAYDGNDGWKFYNNLSGDYTLKLKATSTTVKITIREYGSDGSHKNCKVSYTQEGYFD